jgi:hypothetical protein
LKLTLNQEELTIPEYKPDSTLPAMNINIEYIEATGTQATPVGLYLYNPDGYILYSTETQVSLAPGQSKNITFEYKEPLKDVGIYKLTYKLFGAYKEVIQKESLTKEGNFSVSYHFQKGAKELKDLFFYIKTNQDVVLQGEDVYFTIGVINKNKEKKYTVNCEYYLFGKDKKYTKLIEISPDSEATFTYTAYFGTISEMT